MVDYTDIDFLFFSNKQIEGMKGNILYLDFSNQDSIRRKRRQD